jgi:hypothetical protein
MTKDDIIRMARESNLMSVKFSTALEEMWVGQLERFAKLVASEEREACIRDCDSVDLAGADDCIAAIRARGQG